MTSPTDINDSRQRLLSRDISGGIPQGQVLRQAHPSELLERVSALAGAPRRPA